MVLEAAHDEGMDGVDNEQASPPLVFDLLHRLLDESVPLVVV